MSFGLSNRGEQLLLSDGLVGVDVDITVYDDSTDNLDDTDTTTALSTEPPVTRQTVTVQESDITTVDGDYQLSLSAELDTTSSSAAVDGVVLIESGTTDVIARLPIDDPNPGPKQSLDGVRSFTVEPVVTID